MSPKAVITAVFIAFGVGGGLFAGSIPAVLAASATSKETFGIIIMLNTLASVVFMWWVSRHIEALTPRRTLLMALPLHALGLCVFLLSQSGAMLLAAMLLLALGAATVDLAMNAEGAGLERQAGRPVLARFHGGLSATLAALAVAGSFAAAKTGTWPGAILIACVFAGVWFLARRLPIEAATGTSLVRASFKPSRRAMLLGLVAGLTITGESAAFLWSAKALSEMAPALLVFAGAGVCLFYAFQACGRFAADAMRSRFGDLPLLAGSIALAAAGLAIVAASLSFALSLLGFAMTGLGTAAVVPIVFALATGLDPQARAAGLGFVSLVAGVPRVLSPFLFGYLAEHHSNAAAFGLTSLGLVLALVFALAFARGGVTAGSFRSPRISPADGT